MSLVKLQQISGFIIPGSSWLAVSHCWGLSSCFFCQLHLVSIFSWLISPRGQMQTFDIAVGSLVQRELISNFYFGYIYISLYILMIVGAVLLVNVLNLTLESILLIQHSLEILWNHSSEVLVHFDCYSSPIFMFFHPTEVSDFGIWCFYCRPEVCKLYVQVCFMVN